MSLTTWGVRVLVGLVAALTTAIGAGVLPTAEIEAASAAYPVVDGMTAAGIVVAAVGVVAAAASARRLRGGFLERPMQLVAAGIGFLLLGAAWSLAAARADVPAPPHVVEQVVVLAVLGLWAIGFVELEQSI